MATTGFGFWLAASAPRPGDRPCGSAVAVRCRRAVTALVLGMGLGLGLSVVPDPVQAASEGETIGEVLERSHRQRLVTETARAARGPAAERLRADFERLLALQTPRPAVNLLVVDGPFQAETLAGHTVVVSVRLAELGEGERLFILAHELGHALLGHWGELGEVYARHIPDAVTPAVTRAAAAALGREASRLAHGHEFAADAHAWRTVRELGYGTDSAASALRRMPNLGDTATHPGSRKRLGRLLMLGSGDLQSALAD